jgi:carboxylesterase
MALLTPLGATADRGLILATLAPSLYTPAPEVSINMPFQPDYDVVDERRAYTLTANPNSDNVPQRGVLIIHGFMGSPLSSRPLAEYLNTHGYFVHCPLLPGHGHYPNKLYKVPAKAWLAEVEEAYTWVRANVDELFIIGHSMGNVLGAHLVLKYGDISGMAMLAPVIDVPDRRLRWVKYARFFLPWYYPHKSKRESMQHLVRERVLDFDPTIDFDSPEFQAQLPEVSRVPLSGMHEMVSMIERGPELWRRLDIPVRIYAGNLDYAAPPENARKIFDLLPSQDKEITVFPQAGHELMRPFDPIHSTVWDSIAGFFDMYSAVGLARVAANMP